MYTVNNLPAYYTDYPYLVARLVDGEYWFWGSYKNIQAAVEVALELDAQVFKTAEVEG